MATAPYRVYIDESGDHSYRGVTEADHHKRYLALTGVVISTDEYVHRAPPALEHLKSEHFQHDPDHPEWTFLHRDDIVKRRRAFGVLKDPERNAAWETAILDYISTLQADVYTVVVDKWQVKQRYGDRAFEPYTFCLGVLLNRVRGLLYFYRGRATADVIAMQRTLAEHRRSAGVAPRVQIGIHSTEATKVDGSYVGQGVHEAARIGAVAGPGEIVISATSLEGASIAGVGDTRTVQLKGIAGPVAVHPID